MTHDQVEICTATSAEGLALRAAIQKARPILFQSVMTGTRTERDVSAYMAIVHAVVDHGAGARVQGMDFGPRESCESDVPEQVRSFLPVVQAGSMLVCVEHQGRWYIETVAIPPSIQATAGNCHNGTARYGKFDFKRVQSELLKILGQ